MSSAPAARASSIATSAECRVFVAPVLRGQKVVAVTGAIPPDASWLPATEQAVGLEYQVAAAPSRTGATFSYATRPVLGWEFYVLSRFDNSDQQAAWLRSLYPRPRAAHHVGHALLRVFPGNSIGAIALD